MTTVQLMYNDGLPGVTHGTMRKMANLYGRGGAENTAEAKDEESDNNGEESKLGRESDSSEFGKHEFRFDDDAYYGDDM